MSFYVHTSNGPSIVSRSDFQPMSMGKVRDITPAMNAMLRYVPHRPESVIQAQKIQNIIRHHGFYNGQPIIVHSKL
jgi:hypothetical protein